MTPQIKELSLQTADAIYNAIGPDKETLADVVLYIVSQMADRIKNDGDTVGAFHFLGYATDNLNNLGYAAIRKLSDDELKELKDSLNA